VALESGEERLSFEFKDGMLTNYRADANANCLPRLLADFKCAKDCFGYFRIDLNLLQKVMEDGEVRYWPVFAAGMVWVGIGSNTIIGGENDCASFTSFPVTHATVEVDGKTIIKDGSLVM
jgi:aminopeptidase